MLRRIALSLILWTFGSLPKRNRLAIVLMGVIAVPAALMLVPPDTTRSTLSTSSSLV